MTDSDKFDKLLDDYTQEVMIQAARIFDRDLSNVARMQSELRSMFIKLKLDRLLWEKACLAACRRLADAEELHRCDIDYDDGLPCHLGTGYRAPDKCKFHRDTRPEECK